MKTISTLLLLGFFAFASCDDATTNNEDNTAAKLIEVENRAINGERWRITNFTDTDRDRTSEFTGYIFEFDANGLLTSTNGSENLAGNWAVKDSKSSDENKSEFDNMIFTIDFSNPAMFEGLSANWQILLITDSTIELRHSQGDKAEVIRFERI